MVRKVVAKTSFLGGEAGPLLKGRSDLAQFQLGAETLRNFIAIKGGAITRRPGSRYVKNTLNDKPARLFDYVISYDSGTDIYVVEVSLSSSTTLAFRVIRVSDNSVYTPGFTLSVTVPSTIDLNEIQYAQIGNNMIFASRFFSPLVLIKETAAPTFTLIGYDAFNVTHGDLSGRTWLSVPYLDSNVSAITMTPAATTGFGINLTSSVAYFDAGMVGGFFRIVHGATVGYCQVSSYVSSTLVKVDIYVNFGATTATTNWNESAWSNYRGWPRAVTFYNQRTVFGGTTFQPDTFWLSQTGDYYQMWDDPATPSVSDPQQFTLASQRLNQIRWLVGGKKLTIGTSSSEWIGVVQEEGTNLLVQFNEETTHGSSVAQARKIGNSIPFIQRSGRNVRELNFNFQEDNYVATDLNLFASHVGTEYDETANFSNVTLVDSAWQESPFGILWTIDSAGRLYGLTRDNQQQIAAWHSHKIAGKIDPTLLGLPAGDDLLAQVVSVCSVPSPNGKNDRLWMVVRREINGALAYHVEYIDDIKNNLTISPSNGPTDIRAFLDCASAQVGASSVSWGGYTRFANESIYVIAAAAGGVIVHSGLLTVDGAGNITLPNNPATSVTVGLHADAILRLLPMEGGNNPELSMLGAKGTDTACVRLYQTFGLRVGKNNIQRKGGMEANTSFAPIPFDNTQLPVIPTFTGVKEIQIPQDTDKEASFALAMKEPWPCTILSISSRVVSNEV